MRTTRSLVVLGVLGCIAPSALGGVLPSYDLAGNFSESVNPSMVWSYRHGSVLLPSISAWQSVIGGWAQPQPGWARSSDGNDRLPFVFRSNGSETFAHDWASNAIVLHTTDPANGSRSGEAIVAFTAPFSGRVNISGHTWLGRDIGRANDWSIVHGGSVLASGSNWSGDPFSSTNPQSFFSGSTTPDSLHGLEVCEGDEILLRVVRAPGMVSGDFSVVAMTVTYTAAFPPCSADLNGDCMVNGADLGVLLAQWATAGSADLNGSGSVDGADLGVLLSSWGACPTG